MHFWHVLESIFSGPFLTIKPGKYEMFGKHVGSKSVYHRNKENYRPKNFSGELFGDRCWVTDPKKILSGNYLDR